jgi:hypothetical protein
VDVTKEVEMARIRITTGGGRPAKDKMFERRIAQENARSTLTVSPPAIMGFGKWKGYPVTEVDEGYLLWCFENMDHCPLYITGELKRRGHVTDNFSGSAFLTKKQQAREKKRAKSNRKAEAQSQQAKAKLAAMQAGIETVGSNYERLRVEFDRADGDPNDCPFDTGDYTYAGPSICWVGGQPVITPSEFPKEVQ